MSKSSKNQEKTKSYVSYTGLGFQMAGVFIVGIFGGQYLDKQFKLNDPYFTVGLTLILFIGYMYKLYIDLIKK